MGRPKLTGPREPNGRLSRAGGEYKRVRQWSSPTMQRLAEDSPALLGSAIYVVEAESTGVIKVGLCYDIADRLKKLQAGHHELLRVFWAVRLSDKNAIIVERAFHQLCKGKSAHIRGEWYMCNPRVACNVVMAIIKKMQFHSQPDLNFGVGRF